MVNEPIKIILSMAKTPQEFIEQSIKELSLDGLNAYYFRLGAESIYKYYFNDYTL